MSRPRWKRWCSTPRRLLGSLGVELPAGYHPDLDRVIWGVANIGEVVGQSEQQADRLLRAGVLDADQITLTQKTAA